MCTLPSTARSSIAFNSIAGGDVSAAVVGASLSNLIGIVLTPLLADLLLTRHGQPGALPQAVLDIVRQLLLPIVPGHVARRVGSLASSTGTKPPLGLVDQGTILLLVCNAFGAAVVGGIRRDTPLSALLSTPIACALLPALVITMLTWIARRLGFSREEEIASVFCGSRKSLASGIPMARALLAGVPGGPGTLMLSLIACTVVARRHVDRDVRRAGVDSHAAD